ncbi:MAG: single-stranded DNA-binding protein [Cyanobacteria bacterium SIG26]|nr:single-stranded DNA-binding protein [Cyanobacteria bacterium SIG26]
MSIAKAVVTGIVYKTPKTGYTQNNVAVSSFVLNVGTQEEILVRVISKRQSLESVVSSLAKNQKVLVEGRLQNGVSKMDDGTEKRVFEIEASTIELMGASGSSSDSSDDGDILTFGDMDTSSSVDADVLMDDEEVPF